MEKFCDISEVLSGKLVNKDAQVRGWLHNKRSSGGIQFLLLRDGTGIFQVTLRVGTVDKDLFDRVEKLPLESVIEVRGRVREDPRAPGGYEIDAEQVVVESEAEPNFPITKKYHRPEFLLDRRHLWIRNEKMQAIFRIRAKFMEAAREWFKKEGYTEVQMPIFITAAVEGGSTLFKVDYFDTYAYLTQSWQLYAEATIASVGKIFTIAPSFRAERSRTRRHLTEYWHLEAEVPWCDLDGIMRVEEELVSHTCQSLAADTPHLLKVFGRDPQDMANVKPPFPRITYDEALQMIREDGIDVKWGDDLDWVKEKALSLKFDLPFFVTRYPKGAKAFYHMPDPSRPEVTLSADLLAPEGKGEIIGGGQRIHDLKQLLQRIEEEKLNPKDYDWYIDLRRFGSVPHSGFGLGIERTIMWICKLKHIRDAIAFPRLMNRVYP
jgi:asparaginyl-tRNA synthetase